MTDRVMESPTIELLNLEGGTRLLGGHLAKRLWPGVVTLIINVKAVPKTVPVSVAGGGGGSHEYSGQGEAFPSHPSIPCVQRWGSPLTRTLSARAEPNKREDFVRRIHTLALNNRHG